MNKRVLAIYFSQTGQLGDIMDGLVAPLEASGVSVEKVALRSKTPFPFPWTSDSFFDVMPNCVLGVPGELEPFRLKEPAYDLIVLGYQPWFLSPSIPVNTLLQDPSFSRVLSNTPLITVTGSRNMWLNAYGRLRRALESKGARMVGNIALVDRHPNLISLVTIMHWMFNGKKDRYKNLFPPPGVAPKDIHQTHNYGQLVLPSLASGDYSDLQTSLVRAGAIQVKDYLLVMEKNAGRIFLIWATAIVRKKNKRAWLSAFKYYIIFALLFLGPLVFIVTTLIIKPLFGKRINAQKNYYLYLN